MKAILPALLLAAPLSALPFTQDSEPSHDAQPTILSQLKGGWDGVLEYADYSGPGRSQIALKLDVKNAGPSTARIHFTLFEPSGETVQQEERHQIDLENERYIIDGRSFPIVRMNRSTTNRGVDLVWTGTEEENGETVPFRQSLWLEGDSLVVTKETRTPLQFRNAIRLTRRAPSPNSKSLIGRWKVDLRPMPGAEPYYKEFAVTSVKGGYLEAEFYDSPVRDAFINSDWGAVRFGFVTSDGSGPYYTSGVMRGDRLEGTTLSPGRGFLSYWTAERIP